MYFPQFLVGMFTTSAIVAIWADIETGSVGKALAWTVLTLTILQSGYLLLAFGHFVNQIIQPGIERKIVFVMA